MVRPAFVKLGGSVLTDKRREGAMRRPQAKRLMGELARSEVPTVLFHGAGSFGHPAAARHKVGRRTLTSPRGVLPEVMAGVLRLQAEVVSLAFDAGLEPVPVAVHLTARSEGDQLVDLPVDDVRSLRDDGCTPVLSGTMVRDDRLGWRVASADELMVALAPDLEPRLGLFVTDVDGVWEPAPGAPSARLLETAGPATVALLENGPDQQRATGGGPGGDDVTGRMAGKLARAVALAASCPVLVVNGTVRGRVLDALKGKAVPCTRVESG